MYGTIAKFKVKPGHEEALIETAHNGMDELVRNGLECEIVMRMDNDPETVMLLVVFRDEERYKANAASPEQHARYLAYRQHLAAEPEWMDGVVLSRFPM